MGKLPCGAKFDVDLLTFVLHLDPITFVLSMYGLFLGFNFFRHIQKRVCYVNQKPGTLVLASIYSETELKASKLNSSKDKENSFECDYCSKKFAVGII